LRVPAPRQVPVQPPLESLGGLRRAHTIAADFGGETLTGDLADPPAQGSGVTQVPRYRPDVLHNSGLPARAALGMEGLHGTWGRQVIHTMSGDF
jgi:hypothetical protein